MNTDESPATVGDQRSRVDWLADYTTDAGIDLPQLVHDDYFLAIKLTFNAGLFASAMKLLVSYIDSLAYIEYGERQSVPFIKWLDAYADLTPLGITAPELWELRNEILHVANVGTSVRSSNVRRISFRVGAPSLARREEPTDIFYFEVYDLVQEFVDAQARWLATYKKDPEKFAQFVDRYDATVPDSRIAVHRTAVRKDG